MPVLDPAVSQAKFASQVAAYRNIEKNLVRRGWWMLEAEFPEVFVVFATAKTQPATVAFGAVINFTDYDLVPPSVRIVHPLTREPYLYRNLPTRLTRRMEPQPGAPSTELQFEHLMIAHDADEVPFLCLPGVREYHDHPGHSGDSWLGRRNSGEGTLYFLIEKIARYGLEPISGFEIRLNVALQQTIPPA